jgi:hypothetical protein
MNNAFIGRMQIFEHSQVAAAFEPGSQLYPWKVPIAGASLA